MPEEFERSGREHGIAQDVQAGGAGPRERAQAAGRDLLDRAVEKKDELKQRASALADERRAGAAERASSVSRALHGAADTLRESGEPQLSEWVHEAAGQVERVVGYLHGKRADGVARDLENLARSNPALFLGGTYVAGLALGRFLRATSPEHREQRALRDESDAAPDADIERGGLEESSGAASVMGNLGSTGWSGVGVAPGAFESAELGEQTSFERSRSDPDASPDRDSTMRGSGAGSAGDVFGTRSDQDGSDVRRDIRAPDRRQTEERDLDHDREV